MKQYSVLCVCICVCACVCVVRHEAKEAPRITPAEAKKILGIASPALVVM